MPAQTTNYQCPACTGPLHYDGASGKLSCEYCGSSFSVEEIESMYSEQNEASAAAYDQTEAKWGTDAAGLHTYNCTSCGAELVCDEKTAATFCPYCGNPTIIPGTFNSKIKPDFVIPFKLDKAAAMAALKKHYANKKLLPSVFSSQNQIEKITGVYVPFWLYSGTASGNMDFSAQRVVTTRTSSEEIIQTSFYDLSRAGVVKFENIPVNASGTMDEALLNSIEPYQYKDLKKFSLSYLPGYFADTYDKDADECAERADQRAENTAAKLIRNSAENGYLNVQEKRRDIRLRRDKAAYALLPVWILNTKWNGQNYVFAMNGQTGKMVGDLPMDKGLYWKNHLITGGVIALVLFALNTLMTLL